MKRMLAGVALSALFFASSASAADHVLDLTGDISNLTTNAFTSGGTFYQTGELALGGFSPFVLDDGDTITANVTVTGGPFTLPVRDVMFFGLNFSDLLGGAQPTTSQSTGTFSFDGGALVGAGCGNCTSLITFQSNMPLSFTTVAGLGSFSMSSPYAINAISISYQVNDNAVPEPAAWALIITGFAGAGAMLRRRRRDHAVAAA
jgi:hypothetical protein